MISSRSLIMSLSVLALVMRSSTYKSLFSVSEAAGKSSASSSVNYLRHRMARNGTADNPKVMVFNL